MLPSKSAMPQVQRIVYTLNDMIASNPSFNTDGYYYLSIIFTGDVDPLSTMQLKLNNSVSLPLFGDMLNIPIDSSIKTATLVVTRGGDWVAPFNGSVLVILSTVPYTQTVMKVSPQFVSGVLTIPASTIKSYIIGLLPASSSYYTTGMGYMPRNRKYNGYWIHFYGESTDNALNTASIVNGNLGDYLDMSSTVATAGKWKSIVIPYSPFVKIDFLNNNGGTPYTAAIWIYPIANVAPSSIT